MRLSGFLFGGVVGMAGALYLARKRPGTAAWAAGALSMAGSSIGKKTVSMMMNRGLNTHAATSAPKRSNDTAAKSKGNWEHIESIINSDPAIKEQADQIMAESSSKPH